MATYLLNWNPLKWEWVGFANDLRHINNGFPIHMRWSTGNTKRISKGDTFFIMRLGVPPKGIIGLGTFDSSPEPDGHFSIPDKVALFADITIEQLVAPLDERMLPLDYLKNTWEDVRWTHQASGMSVADPVAKVLQAKWRRMVTSTHSHNMHNSSTQYMEGALKRISRNQHERNATARRKCIEYYKWSCAICSFDFENVYGENGKDMIHVHHRSPISLSDEKRPVDPIKDLIPVCANCHMVIHRYKTPFAIEEVKEMIRSTRSKKQK